MARGVRSMRSFELAEGETAWPTVAVFCGALGLQAGSAAFWGAGLWPLGLAVPLGAACA